MNISMYLIGFFGKWKGNENQRMSDAKLLMRSSNFARLKETLLQCAFARFNVVYLISGSEEKRDIKKRAIKRINVFYWRVA